MEQHLVVFLVVLLSAASWSLAQPGFVGGWRERSASDPDVKEAAAFALQAYNEASNSLYCSKALRVLEAKSQVVAGTKYSLTIELVNTLCKKEAGSSLKDLDLEHCKMPPENQQRREICIFQVWSRPWISDTQLLHMSCKAATA
ncbi:cystatin-like [Sceloporus undulatus]|uniref:cystatin-like n=1 Tax=Sceloporus undulatus TaxID=8520 RepID=UPI001C4C112B|nr:cystatin-like [Sceloporus undulatus]